MLSRYWWLILLGLIYLLSPIDLIPDYFLGPGFIDDLLVLWLIYWLLTRKLAPGRPRDPWSEARYRQQSSGTGNHSSGSSQSNSSSNGKRDPYAILEINPNADFEEVRKAYHRQANRYHPDKVSHLGREFQELAKTKFQDVQWAYETLAKSKGAKP